MEKLFSIAFSFLIVFQSFNIHFGDIVKFNDFLEHAEMHSENYGDDFFVFLSKHYGELKESHKEQHQKEEENHSHTPINHDCNSQIQSSFVLNSFLLTIKNSNKEIEKSTIFYYQDKFSSFEKQKIFQPPQFS